MTTGYDSYSVIARNQLPPNTEGAAKLAETMLTLDGHVPCKLCGVNPQGRGDALAVVQLTEDGGIWLPCADSNLAGLSKNAFEPGRRSEESK